MFFILYDLPAMVTFLKEVGKKFFGHCCCVTNLALLMHTSLVPEIIWSLILSVL